MEREGIWNLIAKKMSGEASPEELLELEACLRQDPDLHYSIQAIYDLWENHRNEEADEQQSRQAFRHHLSRMQTLGFDYPAGQPAREEAAPMPRTAFIRNRLFRTAVLSIAALVVFCFVGSRFFGDKPAVAPALSPPETNSEISTRNGSRTNLLLPDGTRVWLNAGSRINYDKDYGMTRREVRLEGEAFFDVTRNAGKPFVIHTDRLDIRVLGTSFNIRSYPRDKTTEALLVRGSIEVSIRNRPGSTIILKPNEKLIVAKEDSVEQHKPSGHPGIPADNKSLMTIRKPTYEQGTGTLIETSWVDNKLIFRDEEFGRLAMDLERWYGLHIRFTNAQQEHWRFTGTFQKETIEQALEALRLTGGFNYTIRGTDITIYSGKP